MTDHVLALLNWPDIIADRIKCVIISPGKICFTILQLTALILNFLQPNWLRKIHDLKIFIEKKFLLNSLIGLEKYFIIFEKYNIYIIVKFPRKRVQ